MTSHVLKWGMTLAKWLLTAAAFFYVAHSVDGATLMHMLQEQPPGYYLLAAGLLILQLGISTSRWQWIIRKLEHAGDPGFQRLFNLNYISMFFNSCLPGTIGGDVVRAVMAKSEALPMSLAAYSVVLDRLLAVLGIFIMVLFALPGLADLFGLPMSWGAALSGFCLLMVILAYGIGHSLLRRLQQFRLVRWGMHLMEHLHTLLRDKTTFVVLLVQVIIAHGLFCLTAYVLAQSLQLPLTFLQSLMLIPSVLLIAMLPISIGGWGVREASMVWLLALVGVDKEGALMLSVELGLLLMIASLPGAWLWVKHRKH